MSIGEAAFSYNDRLQHVSLVASLISIGPGAFISCESLSSITLPHGLIGTGAFEGCGNLRSVYF